MKNAFKSILMTVAFLSCISANAGVQIGATRIVYPSDKEEVQLSVQSKNTNNTHLVQAWVSNINDQGEAPFIVTPPIMKLAANQETIFHFIYAPKAANLPKDKESVFWANIKFIASTPENLKDQSKLQLASRTRIKLFYRPITLKDSDAYLAYKRLTFSYTGNSLIVKNPTPFYITLNDITLDGVKVVAPKDTLTAVTMMVAPNSQIILQGSPKAHSIIKWNSISDFGSVTPVTQTLLP